MRRSFASAAAAVLMLTLAGCTDGAPDTTPEKADLTVFLESGVTAEKRAAVEQRMQATSNVEGVTFESSDRAYEKLKEEYKDQPAVWRLVKPESLPESFVATVTDASTLEAVANALGGVDGVRNTVIGVATVSAEMKDLGVIMRLTDGVTDDQRGAIDKAVRALTDATSIEFESKDGAFKRLKERADGKADLIGGLDPARTYASIRFKVGVKSQGGGLIALQKLDGVESMLFVPTSTL
jgi:cell division protein FtsX